MLDIALRTIVLFLCITYYSPNVSARQHLVTSQTPSSSVTKNLTDTADAQFQAKLYKLAARNYLVILIKSNKDIARNEQHRIARRIVATTKVSEILDTINQLEISIDDNAKTNTLAWLYEILATSAVEIFVKTEREHTAKIKDSNVSFEFRDNLVPSENNDPILVTIRRPDISKLYRLAVLTNVELFSDNDRLRIAKWFLSTRDPADALTTVASLIEKQPIHAPSLLIAAKADLLSENYQQALNRIDRVINADPTNLDAQLLKANVLMKRRSFRDAIDQFKILQGSEKAFESEIGLSSALLAAGRKQEASQIIESLTTIDDDQLEAKQESLLAIKRSTRPTIDVSEIEFEDTDKNRTREFGIQLKNTLSDLDVILSARSKTAFSEQRNVGVSTFGFNLTGNVTAQTRLSGRFDLVSLDDGSNENRSAGQLRMDMQFDYALINLLAAHEFLSANSLLIEKKIEMDKYNIAVFIPLPYRFDLRANYTNKIFSDKNFADEYQASIQYRLTLGVPVIAFGYQYRYTNFDHPGYNVYFDPQNYSSDQIVFNFRLVHGAFYFFLETDIGQQKFSKNDFDLPASMVNYGTATMGYQFLNGFSAELNAEWSNASTPGNPEVYGDSVFGGRLSYLF